MPQVVAAGRFDREEFLKEIEELTALGHAWLIAAELFWFAVSRTRYFDGALTAWDAWLPNLDVGVLPDTVEDFKPEWPRQQMHRLTHLVEGMSCKLDQFLQAGRENEKLLVQITEKESRHPTTSSARRAIRTRFDTG